MAQKFFCKHCGVSFSSVRELVNGYCQKHPVSPSMHHELYEGSEKAWYTCKYCGQRFSTIRELINNWCQKHPGGRDRRHEPAL
jgi:transcription elongation factor Elf1